MPGMTIAAAIAADDTYVVKVDVPEWSSDGSQAYVCLRPCSSADFDKYAFGKHLALQNNDPTRMRGLRHKLVAMCWCDDDGKYANPTPEEVAQLGDKQPRVIDRLWQRCESICVNTETAEGN